MKSEYKDDWITYFKAIGIMLVVIGHTYIPNNVKNFIYLFHMPMFFFISGYLYKEKDSCSPIKYLKKKLKRLYFEFIKWQCIFLVFHNFLVLIKFYPKNSSYNLKEILECFFKIISFQSTEQLGGAMWFIPALFGTSVIFCIIRFIVLKFDNKFQKFLNIILIVICMIIGYTTDLPRFLSVSFSAISIFYIGFIYRKFEKKIVLNLQGVIISLIILLVLNQFGSINMVNNSYETICFLIVASLSGIYINIYIAKIISNREGINKLLFLVGKRTMDIMILHFVAFKLVSIIIIITNNLSFELLSNFPTINIGGYWNIAYFFIGLLFPLLRESINKKYHIIE